MTNVLLAIDGPLYGKVITDFVLNHQWVPGTNFRLMHAVEPPRGIEAWPEARLNDEEAVAAKTMLKAMAARIEKSLPECKVNLKVCLGYPKEEILTEAKEWPAHMIVMGSHGRTAVQRFLLGSVSLSVLMHATCSTVVVRVPEEEILKEGQKLEATKAKAYGRTSK